MENQKTCYAGRNILALGLGRFGGQVAAIKYLDSLDAILHVSEIASPESVQQSIQQLEDCTHVSYLFGPQSSELLDGMDAVLVSPAIRPDHPCMVAAAERKIPILTEIGLLLDVCPAQIIAVSGTVGKSTTTTMISELLSNAGHKVWIGGNIGHSLLSEWELMEQQDWAVLELSSFQLHYLQHHPFTFHIAVLTNCFPHHLNWHPSWEHYRESKERLFRGDNQKLAVLPEKLRESFGLDRNPLSYKRSPIPQEWPEHLKQNARLALEVAAWFELSDDMIAETWSHFKELPYRQTMVENSLERTIINDSKSTLPAATMAALNRFENGPCWLVLGGALSQDDPAELLAAMASNPYLKGIAWMGPAGELLASQYSGDQFQIVVPNLKEAWEWCWAHSEQSETILLSPGYPSFNEFLNYEHRGDSWDSYVRETEARSR